MAENSGRYSYILCITLITLLFILFGFIGEIFKHQTRQIRYTRSQLLKIGETFYKTKVNDMTANTIRNLDIRQTFRPPKSHQEGTIERKEERDEAKSMLDYRTPIKECTETC